MKHGIVEGLGKLQLKCNWADLFADIEGTDGLTSGKADFSYSVLQ